MIALYSLIFTSQHYVFQGRDGESFKGRPNTRNHIVEADSTEATNINACVFVL